MRDRLICRVLVCPIVLVAVVALVSSCSSLPTPQYPEAAAFVATELASLAARTEYRYEVIDFGEAEERSGRIRDKGVEFASLTQSIGFLPGRRGTGAVGPPDGTFLGSPQHLRLAGAGTVTLREPATVLGMHVSLTSKDYRDLRWIESGREAPLLISGYNSRGQTTGTVRVTPSTALLGTVSVMEPWTWVDLSILGEVSRLDMTFENPLQDLPVLLVDNFTVSVDFLPASGYFTVVLLPRISEYIDDGLEILRNQVSYLSRQANVRETELVYVAHLGGLVPSGADEEIWESVSDTLRPLDRSIEYGVTLSASELEDPDDPALGSLYLADFFPESRLLGDNPRSGLSENGLSSYRVVRSPVGDLLFVHLMVDVPGETVQWAQAVLDEYRNLPTVVVTPNYQTLTDGLVSRTSEMVLSSPPGAEEPWEGRSGTDIWNELIWPNTQIFLVASGDGEGEAVTIGWNRDDKPVIEMLAGYGKRPGGGSGYLRLLRFYPERNQVTARTYSPHLDTWEQDPDSYFTLPLDISGRLGLE